MSITQLPDVSLSAIEYLRSVPEIAAIVSTAAGWVTGAPDGQTSGPRVSGALYKNWKVPTQAIVIRRAGGPGTLYDGWHRTRLDFWCYASNEREAVNLWRWLHPAICPDQSGIVGWTAAGCRVSNVLQEADPIPANDVDVRWSVLITPYVLTWREVSV